MSEHSVLAPSSAARRVACPGSRLLESTYPDDRESTHAREGHAAHWVAQQYLCEMYNGGCNTIPEITPDGEVITQAMLDGARLYCQAITRKMQVFDITKLHIEEKISIATIHPMAWGTPDCWYYDVARRELHIWDYKFGFGFVEVFENWQLISYAAGILDYLKINGLEDQYTRVEMHIIQPRSYHRDGQVRTWAVIASTLRGYFNNLRSTEHEAMEPSAKCNPNPECGYCRGRHACEALQRAALSAVDISNVNTPFDLSSIETGNELRYLQRAQELLEARISGLSEQALAMLQRGERVPGYKAEQSAGREVWKVSASEVIALGELLEIDLAKPPQVITPKQALHAGLSVEMVQAMAETPRGAFKLVQEDEGKMRKIFGAAS